MFLSTFPKMRPFTRQEESGWEHRSRRARQHRRRPSRGAQARKPKTPPPPRWWRACAVTLLAGLPCLSALCARDSIELVGQVILARLLVLLGFIFCEPSPIRFARLYFWASSCCGHESRGRMLRFLRLHLDALKGREFRESLNEVLLFRQFPRMMFCPS